MQTPNNLLHYCVLNIVIMCGSSVLQVMTCHVFGVIRWAMADCQLDPWQQTSLKFEQKWKNNFSSKEMHLKVSSTTWQPFFLAPITYPNLFVLHSDVRRLVVAMSRARLGLYVFGRVSLFQNCFELSPAFKKLTKRPLQLHLAPYETYPSNRKVNTYIYWDSCLSSMT